MEVWYNCPVRTVILFLLCILITLLLVPLLLVCAVFGWGHVLILLGKGFMHLSRFVLGLKVEVHGLERIDKSKPYVFMSNHLSFLDGPLLFMLIPQNVRVILKKEVFRIPVIGMGMRVAGFVPVDRRGIRGGKRSIDRAVRLIRDKRYSFLIFPEGTRSLDGKLQEFKRGGFFLALNSQIPIVPISLSGTFELMPKKKFFVKRGTIKVLVHPPVTVQGYDVQSLPRLIQRVRQGIHAGLAALSSA